MNAFDEVTFRVMMVVLSPTRVIQKIRNVLLDPRHRGVTPDGGSSHLRTSLGASRQKWFGSKLKGHPPIRKKKNGGLVGTANRYFARQE